MAFTNAYWDKILTVIRKFIVKELGGGYSIYVGDSYQNQGNRAIRLHLTNSTLLEQRGLTSVNREYTVEISYYLIGHNLNDQLYDKLYFDTSKIEHTLMANAFQTQPNGFYNGEVTDVTFNEKTPIEEAVDGLITSKITFVVSYESIINEYTDIYSLDFDGTDDFCDYGSFLTVAQSTTQDFTISGWFYPKSNITHYVFGGTSGANFLRIIKDASGNDSFGLRGNEGTLSSANSGQSMGALNVWHHFLYVRYNQKIKLYVNGTEWKLWQGAPTNNYITGGVDFNQSWSFRLFGGQEVTPTTNFLDAKLNELACFTSAHPTTAFRDSDGKPVDLTGRKNMIGWWRFETGSGTIAKDSSGNGNDLTITGATFDISVPQ